MEFAPLAEALGPLMPIPELDALDALLASPRRIVVVGRTSAGKTSFVNRQANTHAPTGLGGVTRQITSIPDGGVLWVDTPGIDGRDRAIDILGPAVDDADALVWVVDGLQPATRTERDVLALLVPEGLPMAVVVSRIDLVPDDREAVLTRVTRLAEPFTPFLLVGADLRHDRVAGVRTPHPSPRRRCAIDRTLSTLQGRFDELVEPLSSSKLGGLVDVRNRVKAALRRVEEASSVSQIVQAFETELSAVRHALVVDLAAERGLAPSLNALPELPEIPEPANGPIDTLRLGAAGRTGTLRELRGHAAGWAAETSILLVEWAETVPTDDLAAAAWALGHAALTRIGRVPHTAR